jgi:DHA2 family multidrug resistance protein-like MFS transporter
LDINSLFRALAQLNSDLGASSIEQLWITDSYGFMVAGFVITMGVERRSRPCRSPPPIL